ncbi:MAG TPA: DNA polymerase I [Terriglobales bacterium]|nr:DNA polymerase I [Terriglobales bacterium]
MPPKPPTPDKPPVFLIDAMGLIFRAYHAMARQRPMSTRSGLPTAATYVFVNMLRKLIADFHPEYLAAVFDVAGPTFRDHQAAAVSTIRKFDLKTQTFQEVEYKGYKATRAETPPDLNQQIPYIRRALEVFRIPILEMQGFEADDVIGTLARQAAARSHPVFVVSSDKDMLQLVNDKVSVLNPPKDNLICDPAKVEEILGVPPDKVVDVMALRGDSVDNIPGAPGIGDKGSVELIRRFGSVEAALERAAEVEKKTYRESLQNNRDTVLFSKQMATIDANVPMELDLGAMRPQPPDVEAARALFTELEFTGMLRELAPSQEVSKTEYAEAKSAADVEAVLAAVPQGGALAVAVESAAEAEEEDEEEEEEPAAKKGKLPLAPPAPEQSKVAISAAPGAALTVSLQKGAAAERLRAALADPGLPKAVHDSKAALHALAPLAVPLAGVRDDSLLFSYLLNPTTAKHGLADAALRRFSLNLSGDLAEAADFTGRVAAALRHEVEEAGLLKLYDQIDLPLVPVLVRMEQAGVKIDSRVLARMSERLEREAAAKAKEIHALAGHEFNINSPKQLGDVLFNRLNLPKPVKYGKGKTISTAVDVLEELALTHDVPRLVLEFRQLSKLKSTYVDALPALVSPADHRLHTTFNAAATATGRLSSVNPNLQNIPVRTELGREIRAAFIAEPGNLLLSADYSQIELRLLAHFSEDKLLTEAFRRGDDIHAQTAARVFGVPPLMVTDDQRRAAKVVNFGIVYGLSAFGLAQQLGITPGEARKFIDAYFESHAGVRRWIDQTIADCRKQQVVRTLFGRVRPIPDINSKNPNMRGFAERTAVNSPLQGTAADLIKLAMIQIDTELERRKLKAVMTLQVHDELVFEAPEKETEELRALVKEKMENAHKLRVPLLVEIGAGPNWRDLD